MRIRAPRPNQKLADAKGFMAKPWLDVVRDLRRGLGFDPQSPMYAGLFVDANSMQEGTGAKGAITLVGGIKGVGFPGGSDTDRMLVARLPSEYRPGTDVTPYVEFLASSTNSGTVKWNLEHSYAEASDVLAAAATVTATETLGVVKNTSYRTELDVIDGDSLDRGTVIVARIEREGATDTYADDAVLLGVGFKYEREGLGNELLHP